MYVGSFVYVAGEVKGHLPVSYCASSTVVWWTFAARCRDDEVLCTSVRDCSELRRTICRPAWHHQHALDFTATEMQWIIVNTHTVLTSQRGCSSFGTNYCKWQWHCNPRQELRIDKKRHTWQPKLGTNSLQHCLLQWLFTARFDKK